MIWIELMGPAGVGKSFWFKRLLQEDSGLNPDVILAERYLSKSKTKLSDKVFNLVYSCDLKKDFIVQKVCSQVKNNYQDDFNVSDLFHIGTFMDGLSVYDSNAINKLRLSNFYYYKMREFKTYESLFKEDDLYLSEDGIMHLNFGDFSKANTEVRLPDAIINFEASDEFILKNRLKRIKLGKGNLIEKMMTPIELETYIKNYNLVYREKVNSLKSLNINVIDLKVEEIDKNDNVLKLLKSIRSAKKRR
ncbi:hypothetical protein [Aequorivita xiaoshiensis]|uniref:Deoxynucleoside kinase domain-containing protein n=1 Tax=Aequorivita xiaoshiensis TaxID=2874476 RepID=A0A9X1R517_9FLAO|nr:hypothetical protein [Aequorivita xiaoshiensis]MCG2431663.1 hypothetical protein [Aequorivita xiaoshiensis]